MCPSLMLDYNLPDHKKSIENRKSLMNLVVETCKVVTTQCYSDLLCGDVNVSNEGSIHLQ